MRNESNQEGHLPSLFGGSIAIAVLLLTMVSMVGAHFCIANQAVSQIVQMTLLISGHLMAICCASSRNGMVLCTMLAGMVLKLAASSLHVALAHWGASDAMVYFSRASDIAAVADVPKDLFETRQIWGTELIVALTAVFIKCLGASMELLTAIYGSLSFWGEYFYFLAFCVAFPTVRAKAACAGLFLLPSIVFWPAALGKDALMLFFLGIAAFSIAQLTRRKALVPRLLLIFGVLGCSLVRPHITTLLVISLAASIFFGRIRTGSHATRFRRFSGILLFSVTSLIVLYACIQLLEISNLAEGADRLRVSMALNQQDGSGFSPADSITIRLIQAPLLLVRPFPWEINGIEAGLASGEGVIIALLVLIRLRRILDFFVSQRHDRFVMFLVSFVILNVLLIGLASSNFGLLVRERVMIYPPIVMLIVAASAHSSASTTREAIDARTTSATRVRQALSF